MHPFTIFLTAHIIFGTIAVGTGPLAVLLFLPKALHKLFAYVYFIAITVVCITAAAMVYFGSSLFLLLISIFSYYFAFTAFRIFYKDFTTKKSNTLIDWIAIGALALSGLSMYVLGIKARFSVLIIFGVIACFVAYLDYYKIVNKKIDKNILIRRYITYYLASYIAIISALSVVTFDSLPTVVRWLWPTVIGTPCIVFLNKYYSKKND